MKTKPVEYSLEEKEKMVESITKALKEYIFPEGNEVSYEWTRPPIEDHKRTILEGHGMHQYLKPGPDIFLSLHFIVKERGGN